MNISIIGTGYVGLPTGVGLAELGHKVTCIDREESKINRLKSGQITLYEDGLLELFLKNKNNGNISFTTSMQEGISNADVVLIAVGTPEHPVTHEADLRYLYAAATELSVHLKGYTVVANKSTVPVGTADMVESLILKSNKHADIDVVSLPEFLREGFALHDFFQPDRIIAGVNSERVKAVIEKMYEPLLERNPQTKLLFVNRKSSETIKYASNSFLATKIHFINEMADFCEKTGANVYEVALGMGLDHRIGTSFLNPGPGFGGSCFPKDTNALAFMAQQNKVNLSLVNTVIEGNHRRLEQMADRILALLYPIYGSSYPASSLQATIGVLGLAFKAGTDDCRSSPALDIIVHLLKKAPHLRLQVYDPKAMTNVQALMASFNKQIVYCNSALDVCKGADVLTLLTEWPEFKSLDLAQVKNNMQHLAIADFRNMINPEYARDLGFVYQGIGM